MSSTTTVTPPTIAVPPAQAPVPGAPAIVIEDRLRIPAGINDLESFRRWARSTECPERGRFAYLNGVFWMDFSKEQLYSHNQVKGAVGAILWNLAVAAGIGRYLPDGMLLSNARANLSTVPDGLFVSYQALQSGRVRQVPGSQTGVVELEGTPDMVLEVVSDSSVEKDTIRLPDLYQQAGIPEFWRIDARGPEARFEILRLSGTEYVPTRQPDEWWRSDVFNRSFRLTQQVDPLGQPVFTLEVR
jgi:Uma2 family endonuclease